MRDLISRQAAIAALGTITMYKGMISFDTAMERINRMPPAELGTNLAEVGTDCISRQQAIDALYSVDEYNSRSVKAIKQLPTIQPKRGKWIRDGHHIRCDQCGMYMCDTDREGDRIPTEFCPNCGADMRGEQE